MDFIELEEIGNLDDYEGQEDEPSEEDIFISDTGHLGCNGKVIHHGNPDHTDGAIRAWMETEQYWPNVWTVSDHGNIHPHAL